MNFKLQQQCFISIIALKACIRFCQKSGCSKIHLVSREANVYINSVEVFEKDYRRTNFKIKQADDIKLGHTKIYNNCTYQMIPKEFNIKSAAIHKIIQEELQMKKLVCHWVSHNLTEYQKTECIRVCKETLSYLMIVDNTLFLKS